MEDLANDAESERKMKPEVRRALEGIERDEADLILWVGENGDLAVRSVLVSFGTHMESSNSSKG